MFGRRVVTVLLGSLAIGVASCTSLLGDFTVTNDVGPDGSNTSEGGANDGGAGGTDGAPCVPETDVEVCARLGKTCDGIIALDRCGLQKTITSCGSCTLPARCGLTAANVCGCKAETDADVCKALGKNCDKVVGKDSCGVDRTVNCGTCTGAGESCGKHVPNVCGAAVCVPETDTALCDRYGKNCDLFVAVDNCAKNRQVQCGACVDPLKCGAITANVCGCLPESDGTFCTRIGRRCGPANGLDNCGKPRAVANCGSCGSGPAWTCSSQGTCACPSFPAGDPQAQVDLCSDGVTCVYVHTMDDCAKCGDKCVGPNECIGCIPPNTNKFCGVPSAQCQ